MRSRRLPPDNRERWETCSPTLKPWVLAYVKANMEYIDALPPAERERWRRQGYPLSAKYFKIQWELDHNDKA